MFPPIKKTLQIMLLCHQSYLFKLNHFITLTLLLSLGPNIYFSWMLFLQDFKYCSPLFLFFLCYFFMILVLSFFLFRFFSAQLTLPIFVFLKALRFPSVYRQTLIQTLVYFFLSYFCPFFLSFFLQFLRHLLLFSFFYAVLKKLFLLSSQSENWASVSFFIFIFLAFFRDAIHSSFPNTNYFFYLISIHSLIYLTIALLMHFHWTF